MPFNGSGLFTRVHDWTDDAAALINITASRMDAEDDGFATGLSTCVTKDGQTTITANLPMAGFRHTGVGNASARTDYAAAGQVQDGAYEAANDGGAANAYTITLAPAPAAYAAHQMFRFKAANANTGASTLNVNALGAKAIQLRGRALTGGEIGANHIVAVVFDGTQFQMISPVSAGGWELIQEQTPGGGVAQIDFTTGFTTAYDVWMFVLTDVLPDTDNRILHMQISDDGSTFEADATDYEYNVVAQRSATAGITNKANSQGDTKIILTGGIGSASGEGASGIVVAHNLRDAPAGGNQFTWQIGYFDNTATAVLERCSGCGSHNGGAGPILGVRFLLSANNISGGSRIAMYGLRRT